MGRITIIVAVVLGLAAALPAAAGAATELGQVQAAQDLAGCEAALSLVQRTTAPGVSYEVPPGGGVITSWRHRARADEGSEEPAGGRLQVWRPTTAGYVLAGRSSFEAFAPGVVNEFTTQIPVSGGELIGLRVAGKPQGCASNEVHGPADVVAADDIEDNPADPLPGFTWTPPFAIASTRVNVAATLDTSSPAPAALQLTVEAAAKQKVKTLEVTVGCGPAACDAQISGKAVAKKGKGAKGKRAVASKKRKKKFPAAPTTLQVPSGQTVTERVKLKKKGKLRKLLRQKAFRRKTKAKLLVSATDAAGNTATERAKVKLKR